MTSGTYRSEVESLRAELNTARAGIARLTPKSVAKAPMRWGVVDWSGVEGLASDSLAAGFCALLLYAVVCMVAFSWPMEQRAGVVFAGLVLLWCLAFVRRVPR